MHNINILNAILLSLLFLLVFFYQDILAIIERTIRKREIHRLLLENEKEIKRQEIIHQFEKGIISEREFLNALNS